MSMMRAAVLCAPRQIEVRAVAAAQAGPRDVLLRPVAVGICGTDMHIWSGDANYNIGADGRAVPLEQAAQVLGHEIVAEVLELPAQGSGGPMAHTAAPSAGAAASLRVGQRVVLDQGLNCHSQGRAPVCSYCSSGHSHHCAHYCEHGITGLPGGFAERIAVPWMNVLPLPDGLAVEHAACTEPLACVLHACDVLLRARDARFAFGDRVQTIAICGGGTAGQMFVQVLRQVLGFRGRLLLSDPSPLKRGLASTHGAEALDASAAPFDALVRAATGGHGAELVIEASGSGGAFTQLAGALRRQGTVLLYAHGHGGAPLSALNGLHWLEPTLLLPNGASGALDADGRPLLYARALQALESGAVRVDGLISRKLHGLEQVAAALEVPMGSDEIKRVVML